MKRTQDNINASNQALRLSDGKYASDLENWELSKQSYEKAAQMDIKDFAPPYNAALCFDHLGYFNDAANWFEEVLRRNPNHPEKREILNKIEALRRK